MTINPHHRNRHTQGNGGDRAVSPPESPLEADSHSGQTIGKRFVNRVFKEGN
jgi:hypothetical protein